MSHSTSYQNFPIESLSMSPTLTGPFGSGQALSVSGLKIGNLVTWSFPAVTAAAAVGTSAVATVASAIPTSVRPTSTIQIPINILNNSLLLNQIGKCVLSTNGTIQMFFDILETGTWGALGNNGWRSFCISYLI